MILNTFLSMRYVQEDFQTSWLKLVYLSFSFDACYTYHQYYRGVYGNVVALADTKKQSLTTCAFALSTDNSEHGGLYKALFDVIKDGENASELIEVMKKKSSVVISDDNVQFRGVAPEALANDRQFATCSWH